jgi:hypothetical protein
MRYGIMIVMSFISCEKKSLSLVLISQKKDFTLTIPQERIVVLSYSEICTSILQKRFKLVSRNQFVFNDL